MLYFIIITYFVDKVDKVLSDTEFTVRMTGLVTLVRAGLVRTIHGERVLTICTTPAFTCFEKK